MSRIDVEVGDIFEVGDPIVPSALPDALLFTTELADVLVQSTIDPSAGTPDALTL